MTKGVGFALSIKASISPNAADGAPPAAASSLNTALGLVAILFWSTTVACSRSLIEKLGMFTAAFLVYFAGAVVTAVITSARPGTWRAMLALPRAYLIVCGSLFGFYLVVLYAALGMASDRHATVVVGIINYLWSPLTLVFAIPILKKKARWTLYPGILLALAGIVLALWKSDDSAADFLAHLRTDYIPYLLALAAAVAWALYSDFSKRLGGDAHGAVPLFLLFASLLLGLIRLFRTEASAPWTAATAAELAYMAICPAAAGYLFWDAAIRKGNLVLLAVLSYFIPICATFIAAFYLDVSLSPELWIGCVLVTVGAVVCRYSFR